MENFKFKGIYKNENQILRGELPKNAVKFNESNNMRQLNLSALLVTIFIVIISLMILIHKELIFEPNPLEKLIIIELVSIFIGLVLSFLNYFVAIQILYPKKSEKEVWIYLKCLTIYIYCNEPISRNRFIIVNLLPATISGFFPFMLWSIGVFDFNSYLSIFIMFFSLANILFNIGLLIKSFTTIKQAPKNSTIRNYGFNSYWY